MEELPTRSKDRIAYLKRSYVGGDISEGEFELFLDAAFEDETPFFKGWFRDKLRDEVRHKRYAEDEVYIYQNTEYVIEGKRVVEVDSEEVDRTIDVRAD